MRAKIADMALEAGARLFLFWAEHHYRIEDLMYR